MENKTPDEIAAEKKAATDNLASSEAKAKEVEAQFYESLKKIASLEKQVKALQKENSESRGTVSKLAEQVALLVKGENETPAETKIIPKDSFEVGGQKWKFTIGGATIPKIGKRTAMEILTDDTEYPALGGTTIKEWLVKNNSKMIQAAE